MTDLLDEARRMPNASVGFARGISQVWTPEHLIPLRTTVRSKHGGAFRQLQTAINERFGTTGGSDNCVNVFYAAGEMALMEQVGREELPPGDRTLLRQLWNHLLHAK